MVGAVALLPVCALWVKLSVLRWLAELRWLHEEGVVLDLPDVREEVRQLERIVRLLLVLERLQVRVEWMSLLSSQD